MQRASKFILYMAMMDVFSGVDLYFWNVFNFSKPLNQIYVHARPDLFTKKFPVWRKQSRVGGDGY